MKNELNLYSDDKLRQIASQAFDAEFRDQLCNAVQRVILEGGKIGVEDDCYCPEGCLFDDDYYDGHPLASVVQTQFPQFTYKQHNSFQLAFDEGPSSLDNHCFISPERALGLLYRKKFVK